MNNPLDEKDGGRAFPFLMVSNIGIPSRCGGMSLRDYFATHASDKDVDSALLSYKVTNPRATEQPSRVSARFLHADAMLSERAKSTT